MRTKRKDPVKIALIVSVGMLFCVSAFFAFFALQERQNAGHLQSEMQALEQTLASVSADGEASLTRAENAEASIRRQEEKIAALEEQVHVLAGSDDKIALENASEQIQILLEQINGAKREAASATAALNAYHALTHVDWNYQTAQITKLLQLLEHGAPLLTGKSPFQKEEETKEPEVLKALKETTKEEWTTLYPSISFYYEDIETGYHIAVNADQIRYTASLIKAPYLYAVIREIEDFEKQKTRFAADGTPLYDENGNALFSGRNPNLDDTGAIRYADTERKYDLSELWTYDPKTMYKEGSGEIQKEKAGFQLTWRELFEYALLYSDNIAFAQIRERFGMTAFNDMVARLSVHGTSWGFMQLSAEDCGKFLRDMYTYFETESSYAVWMRDVMRRSTHAVMIPIAVSPLECAHKYGWDEASYHDMGIVYDTHPFLLVFMSNMDTGGTEVDTYIRSVVQQCLQIHRTIPRDAAPETSAAGKD